MNKKDVDDSLADILNVLICDKRIDAKIRQEYLDRIKQGLCVCNVCGCYTAVTGPDDNGLIDRR